ncbi:hypothetical protein [Saccharothrix coeruleofusca]|uniref:Lipoprotein n=1 Tax=Saccharothrix coeruleofusca TaxID=33919 RepID=A0A918AQ24_9PSEU|nr:hypothetical protein [Saccharothrix coeruleofusca]GGP56816.1 lipoprotein [Saccharothrix coeruleofusca]
MLRKHVAPLAALLAAGALALSACGTTGSAQPSPSSSPTQQQETGSSGDVSLLSGTARSNKADEQAGDLAPDSAPREVKNKWVQLRASQAGELNPVVVNGAGFTLYRFDKDTANPSKSTCNGDCAKTWPPVTIAKGGKVFFSGIKKADIGAVTRDDGQLQLTVKGWPVYRFNKDAKPGDTNGQGVGGTWFGVRPDGQKAGDAAKPSTPATAPSSAPPADDAELGDQVTLFTGKDFDDFSGNNFATGITGPGCKDIRGTFLSAVPSGPVKLWAEPGCKGTSVVVDDDARDLTALGFPNGPKSVRFAG